MPKQSSTACLNLDLGYLEESGSSIQVDTPEFQDWLHNNDSFRVEALENSYRARKESYTGVPYWYAIKKVAGKLHKRFIGKTGEVTLVRLNQIAQLIRQPSAKSSATSATSNPTEEHSSPEPQKTEIVALQAEIKAMQQQFSERLNTMQQQIDSLQQGKIAA
ncbi:MAG: hypothetical protein PUP92_00920 [Rhizonema sp. PD38]|nr:hypothetical protein [Rhizonema sp. PD38]